MTNFSTKKTLALCSLGYNIHKTASGQEYDPKSAGFPGKEDTRKKRRMGE